MDKFERLRKANALIGAISVHGRRFFAHEERTAKMTIKLNTGHLYWQCEYSGKSIFLGYKYWKFHHGGTMRHLVNALADYVRGKRDFPIECLGPWSENICGGDLWGYGLEEMEALRVRAKEIMENVEK